MKKLLVILMLTLTTLTVAMSGAEAKRLGGGGSFGKQSSNFSRQAPTRPAPSPANVAPAKPAAPAAAPAAVPPKPASPWKGILGGALLGLGLGALLSHFGMGGAMAGMFSTILMVALLALVAMFLFRMFTRKSGANAGNSGNGSSGFNPQPAYASAAEPAVYTPEIGSRIEPTGMQTPAALQSNDVGASGAAGGNAANAPIIPWGIPSDFDVAGFVRNGKSYFIRLQAAWDKADINDIREFTTPEMFGELRLQLQERGSVANNTDVVQIDGELLGIETLASDYLATIKFTGLIKEAPEASAEPFAEIWNLSKPVNGPGGWVLAGIQQI